MFFFFWKALMALLSKEHRTQYDVPSFWRMFPRSESAAFSRRRRSTSGGTGAVVSAVRVTEPGSQKRMQRWQTTARTAWQ